MAYESPTMSSTQPKPDLRQSCIDRPLSLRCCRSHLLDVFTLRGRRRVSGVASNAGMNVYSMRYDARWTIRNCPQPYRDLDDRRATLDLCRRPPTGAPKGSTSTRSHG